MYIYIHVLYVYYNIQFILKSVLKMVSKCSSNKLLQNVQDLSCYLRIYKYINIILLITNIYSDTKYSHNMST